MAQTTRPTGLSLPNVPTQRPTPPQKKRTGGRKGLIALVVLGLVAGAGFFWRDAIFGMMSTKVDPASRFQTHTVRRGLMRVTVTEDGNVESAKNVDVKCLVEGGSTILEIVNEGQQVTAGTVLFKLDSSAIEEQLTTQKIAYEKARSTYIQAEEAVAVAEIAIREYEKGTFLQELQVADANIVIAKENLKNAEAMLSFSERMFRKGYIGEQQLESNRFAVERSKLDLDTAETARNVLVEFTKAKMLKELQSARDTAEAQMLAEKAALELEKKKLEHLEQQLERCVVRAPQDGMVIYAHEQRRFGQGDQIEEGAAVRQNQSIIRLPDLSQMEVKVLVHETKVNKIASGMKANIRIRDWRTKGSVVSVATQAEPGSWFSASVKEYAAIVRIDDELTGMGIKPGMTAEVEIVVAELRDALTVPLLGVIQQGRQYYCFVADPSSPTGYTKRQVVVGMTNDRELEIKDGLSEGDRVILNPRATVPEARENNASAEKDDDGAQGGAQKDESGGESEKSAKPEEPGAPVAEKKPQRNLLKADKDGDGKVSLDEAPEGVKPFFSKVDKNGDGYIDASEAKTAKVAAKNRQPQGQPQE